LEKETFMKLKQAAVALALASGLAGTSSAFANGPDERPLWEMLQASASMRADRMVTKSEFIKTMEKRFDAMDTRGKGTLSPEEVAKLLDPNIANP
jgi:hypothetical protein